MNKTQTRLLMRDVEDTLDWFDHHLKNLSKDMYSFHLMEDALKHLSHCVSKLKSHYPSMNGGINK